MTLVSPAWLLIGAMAAVTWGAFAFGAVYPWAFLPLALSIAIIGGLALLSAGSGPSCRRLAGALASVAALGALQLVPLPLSILHTISPQAEHVVQRHRDYMQPMAPLSLVPRPEVPADLHTLSIAPDRTRVGLGLLLALAIFMLGMIRVLSMTSVRRLGPQLVTVGVVLAVTGIGQYVTTIKETHPLIYGFWQPESGGRSFGPFINPNHFAGWMLMVIPITLGLFYDTFLLMLDEASQYTRNRVAMASSPRFGSAIILSVCAGTMALSLIMTRSRSGLIGFAFASALCAWLVFRRQRTNRGRWIAVAAFVALLFGAVGWAGLDTVSDKFRQRLGDQEQVSSIGNRVEIWSDVVRIVRDFPVVGTGLNTFGTAMFVYQTHERSLQYQEAHNDYLQLLAEGGLVMAAAILWLIWVFVGDVRQRFREAPKEGNTYWTRVGAVIGIAAIALQSFVEFSLQMPGNATLFALLCAIALHQSPSLRPRRSEAQGEMSRR